MNKNLLSFLPACLLSFSLQAQICNPALPPTGLASTYTPGGGALLQWDVVPGSVGIQIKATSPSGASITRRIIGFERDQFLVPDALLSPGTYTWQIQAACSATLPLSVTPLSASNNFTVEGGSTCPATVTDLDGNVYSTVQIGLQCWIAENLKVEHYQNGDAIPTGLSNSAWEATTTGAFAVYNNSAANKNVYGLLYNGYATTDARGLCPSGWHVPSDAEWTSLTSFLGGEAAAGGKLKSVGTLSAGTGLWLAPNAEASNSSGFSGLPGGFRDLNGAYASQGNFGFWWSSSEVPPVSVQFRGLFANFGNVYNDASPVQLGNSVRCLLDE